MILAAVAAGLVIAACRERSAAPIATPARAAYEDARWQTLVSAAVKLGRLPLPGDIDPLLAPDGQVRPAGVVIEDARPTFQWPARPGGTYVVVVFAGDREVMRSGPLRVPRWTPERDLPQGRTLTWQVEATRGGAMETIPTPPASPAMLLITSESAHQELARARALRPPDDLLLAVLYAESGMRPEALAALRRAAERDARARSILEYETSPLP